MKDLKTVASCDVQTDHEVEDLMPPCFTSLAWENAEAFFSCRDLFHVSAIKVTWTRCFALHLTPFQQIAAKADFALTRSDSVWSMREEISQNSLEGDYGGFKN